MDQSKINWLINFIWNIADSILHAVRIVVAETKINYEISFTRYFYIPPVLRRLAGISADILALEQETGGLLSEITGGNAS